MYLQLRNYHNANEILYVLHSVRECSNSTITKLGVQKLLFLSASLAPVKDVVLSCLEFLSEKRGPYSSNIQNILDHLVAYNLIQIVDFKVIFNKASMAQYTITEEGIIAVNELIKYNKENDLHWWINTITKIAYLYSLEKDLDSNNQFQGLDKIVKLVYQDPTFKDIKKSQGKRALINLEKNSGLTFDLIKLTKDYIQNNPNFNFKDTKTKAEYILLAFFEYLYIHYLDEEVVQ